eukprot:gene28167-34012_t
MSGYASSDLHSCTSMEDHDDLSSDVVDLTFEYFAPDTETFEQSQALIDAEEKSLLVTSTLPSSLFDYSKPLPPWQQKYTDASLDTGKGDSIEVESSENQVRPAKRNKSKHELSLQRKSRSAIQIAINMLAFFNSGDVDSLKSHIEKHFHLDCKLKTPAIDDYVTGQQFIFDFLEGVLLAHADVVMFGKNFRYHNQEISFVVYFAGSKDRSTEKDYLFKKQTRSRVDEMKTDSLSLAEVERLRKLERSGKVIAVQGKGCFIMKMDGEQVKCMDCTWTITSMDALPFAEAS